MRQLLPHAHKPSHFLGCEPNSIHKSAQAVSLRWGLAFPDVYEVGMSYLGQAVLYQVLNADPRIWAERVFAPHRQMAGLLRDRGLPLCTLESDTPLGRLDILGFSLTHELCFTTALFMLDLAGLPLRAEDRTEAHPLIVAGGAAVMNPAPILPFFDCFVVGEGEEVAMEISLAALAEAEAPGAKARLLGRLERIPGILVPGRSPQEALSPGPEGMQPVERRIVPDLDQAPWPEAPLIPFGKPVHDRLTLEIARGCTRGCRFCQAGMVTRPVRERSLELLDGELEAGLENTGYEALSFLSLSAGDFSALDSLVRQSFGRCSQSQVAISLPSLRVGSLSPGIMSMLSRLRRTGATLAPEAGSERLRRVINKGVTEADLLHHAEQLFSLGWHGLKLYFMIGLPTETEEDLRAVLELCRKVRDLGRSRGRRLRVTASVTPFIPKPHTPFQWEAQISLGEAWDRLELLRGLFREEKNLELRSHDPAMSLVEGIFSRGGPELAPVLEEAFGRGEIFTSWQECFDLALWENALQACGLDPAPLLGPRSRAEPLPWDMIQTGVSKDFLWKERQRAVSGRPTPDCRYHACRQCGVCTDREPSSLLESQAARRLIVHRLNRPSRDQEEPSPEPLPERSEDLGRKATTLRLWYAKEGPSKYLSQLELQTLFERIFRRAGLPMAFSRGYHPQPLISFGRALPVGVASRLECCSLCLRREPEGPDLLDRLNAWSIPGLRFLSTEPASGKKLPQPARERFLLRLTASPARCFELAKTCSAALRRQEIPVSRRSKKGKMRTIDIRPLLEEVSTSPSQGLYLTFSWENGYLNPLALLQSLIPGLAPDEFELLKLEQMSGAERARASQAAPSRASG